MSNDKKRTSGVSFEILGRNDLPDEIKKMITEALGEVIGAARPQTTTEKAAEITLDELLEIEAMTGKRKALKGMVAALEQILEQDSILSKKWWEKIRSKYGLDGVEDQHLRLRDNSLTIDRIKEVEPAKPEMPTDPPTGPIN